MFNLFRHCRKHEISFDIVAKTGDIVAKNTMLPVSAAMSPVSATLSLVWTGLLATLSPISATMSPFLATLSLVWRGLNKRVSVCAVDRCGSLKPPARGYVMCSAGGSDTAEDVTTCRLVCPQGLTLPRPADNQPSAADRFQCRRDVGVWTPTDRVPSCVGQSVPPTCTLSRLLIPLTVLSGS